MNHTFFQKIVRFALVVCLFASCTRQTFTIEARHIDSMWAEEGDTVRLYFKQGDSMMVAETQVSGGAFVLTSFATKPHIGQLQIATSEPFAVGVERGNISVRLYENEKGETVARLQGTKNNDVLGAFSDLEQRCFFASPVNEMERQQQISQFADSAFDLIQKYANTPASNYLFVNLYMLFSLEQKSQFFAVLNEKNLADADMKYAYETYVMESRAQVGMNYTDFSLRDLNDSVVALSSMVGQTDYLLLDFWASWCNPCKELIPSLREIYKEYGGGDRLEIVSVSVDRNVDDWRTMVDSMRMVWPQLRDEESVGVAEQYGVMGIPMLFLLNREGTIVLRDCSEDELWTYLLE